MAHQRLSVLVEEQLAVLRRKLVAPVCQLLGVVFVRLGGGVAPIKKMCRRLLSVVPSGVDLRGDVVVRRRV